MALAIPESIAKSAITALNTVTGALDEAADRVATWISWKFALVFVFAGITAVANQNYLTDLWFFLNFFLIENLRNYPGDSRYVCAFSFLPDFRHQQCYFLHTLLANILFSIISTHCRSLQFKTALIEQFCDLRPCIFSIAHYLNIWN